jgi:DNA-binding transcriptional ArsR family regulator
MNAFFEHHKDSIQFGYRCFDRILLNGLIQPFQQPERVLGFFNAYREGKRVTRKVLSSIADQFQNFVRNRSEKWGAPILEPPDGDEDDSRRDKFIEKYFQDAKPNQVVAILKAREPARILIAIGDKDNDSPHLEYKRRWVNQYNFYLNDSQWGRMFVRMCPYFPFSARLCLNQHHWLAHRLQQEGIDFERTTNALLKCADPIRLQKLADSLTPGDLLRCGQKWLAMLTPFFSDKERREIGCQHRLFFSQVEYCDNLIFHRRAGVEELTQRLLDVNRNIGQPKKITTIFGRKITKEYKGKLQTVIEDRDLPNPVIRSHYGQGFLKQYVRDERLLRTESATNNIGDYGVNKDVKNLPQLRAKVSTIIDNYHNAQQDILETFVDRGQLQKLAEPTVLANGKRIPGLKLDHPRQLAVMHAVVRFANIAGGGTFTTSDLHAPALDALGLNASKYSLASLRYDLSKLRAKGLVEKVPRSRRYRLVGKGYSTCLVFLKLFEKIYAPLTAGLLRPFSSDRKLAEEKRSTLDRLYQRITDDLDELLRAVGLKTAA